MTLVLDQTEWDGDRRWSVPAKDLSSQVQNVLEHAVDGYRRRLRVYESLRNLNEVVLSTRNARAHRLPPLQGHVMHALPPPASGFLEALERTGGFNVAWHQTQSISIRHDQYDQGVLGGWSRLGHWFVAHSLAVGHEALLESRGFRPHTRRRRHADGTVNIYRVWVLPGAGSVGIFREVLFRLSGLSMPTPDDVR